MTLLEARKTFNLSQIQAAEIIKVPLRTYVRYEADDDYGDPFKRQMMIDILIENCEFTETKGVYTVEQIKDILAPLFNDKYTGQIEFCYLFGSYAKGYARDNSDVDLCVSTSLKGLSFAGLSEDIRQLLHKRIDLVRLSNLENNFKLINEIMRDGIKIF